MSPMTLQEACETLQARCEAIAPNGAAGDVRLILSGMDVDANEVCARLVYGATVVPADGVAAMMVQSFAIGYLMGRGK